MSKNTHGYLIFPAGELFHQLDKLKIRKGRLLMHPLVKIRFPTRINAIVLDQTKVAPNEAMIFSGGEVLFSIGRFIYVQATWCGNNSGNLSIDKNVKRKSLVKHAYHIMCKALDATPSLCITVDESEVIKHSGVGTSGAILRAVCVAINEMYGCPIKNLDLLQYIAGNYGEEVDDINTNELQCNPCFGGSISTGLFEGGIQILSGFATPIFQMHYSGNVLIGIPNDYTPYGATEEISRHATYLFKNTDPASQNSPVMELQYNHNIAFQIIHKVMPNLVHGEISELGRLIYDFNYSNESFSVNDTTWLYPRSKEIANHLSQLYLNGHCLSLGISSVGPAFYAIVKNEAQEKECRKAFEAENLTCLLSKIWNEKYQTSYD